MPDYPSAEVVLEPDLKKHHNKRYRDSRPFPAVRNERFPPVENAASVYLAHRKKE